VSITPLFVRYHLSPPAAYHIQDLPLGEMIGDVFLEILAFLPLGAIVRVAQVQSAWKKLVDANESHIYHNAAMLHRFVPEASTTLQDAVHALEFDTSFF
jgi:hypothetical protein